MAYVHDVKFLVIMSIGTRGPKIFVGPWAWSRRLSGPRTDQQ